jgi:hypothetical protein
MAVFSTIGSIIAGGKQAKAVDKASDAQAAASKEAIALQRDIYNKNVGFQTPYLNTGNAAMAQMNALLGLQVPQGQQQGGTNALPSAPIPAGQNGSLPGPFGDLRLNAWRQRIESGDVQLSEAPSWIQAALGGGQQPGAGQQPGMTTPTVTQPSANAAYEQFKNYTGYQTRLNEANNAFNSAYAAKGTLQSGAALQDLSRMNQDYASGEFGNYMGYLGGQQQLGPGAANALGGVGTNYANQAGNLAMQNGNNIANAAIARANNTNQMWSGIAGGIGGMAGSVFGGSSYGG